jgi:hypothetical protein
MKFTSLILALTLSGCSLIDKPNNTAAFASNQIVALAEQIERAQSMGTLSESEGDKYLAELLRANNLLIDSSVLVSGFSACDATDTRLKCVDKVLAQVEQAL